MRRPAYIKFAGPFALILIVVLTLLVVKPQYQKLKAVRQNLAQEKVKLQKLEDKLEALEAIDEIKLQEKATLSLKALPARKDVFEAMEVIDRLAQETGVIIEKLSVNPGEIEEEEGGTEAKIRKEELLAFKLELLGTQEQLQKFLESLGEFIPLADTKRVTLGASEGVSSSEFSLELYFSPLPKEIGRPEDPLPELSAEEEKILEKIAGLPYYVSEVVLTPAFTPSGRTNPFTF